MEEHDIFTDTHSEGQEEHEKKSISNFFYQLAIVVIGIMITFAGSEMIGKISARNQLRQSMRLVILELEKNLDSLNDIDAVLTENMRIFGSISEYAEDLSAISDTLERYASYMGRFHSFTFQKNALEVLKVSGVIQQESSQKLLQQLFDCYDSIQEMQSHIETYNENKSRKISAFMEQLSPTQLKQFYSTLPSYLPLWQLYVEDRGLYQFLIEHQGNNYVQSIVNNNRRVKEKVSETIELLRRKYKL